MIDPSDNNLVPPFAPEGEEVQEKIPDAQGTDQILGDTPEEAPQTLGEGKKIEAFRKIVEDLQDKYLRAAAETENMRRRCVKDIEEAAKYANAALARDIIAFVDNLERAVACCPSGDTLPDDVVSFIDGVRLISGEVLTALERHGIKKVATQGAAFNPELHQAISEVEAKNGANSGEIVETLQTGYTLNGRLLRAAMVVVAR
jgi:molecular chaperone GrpE